MNTGRPAAASALLSRSAMQAWVLVCLLAAAPQAQPQDPARAGCEAIQRSDGEKAAAAFRAQLAANPDDPRALTGSAIAAHLLGRDDQATSFLKRALQADPDNA